MGQPNIIHFTSLNIASSSSDNFARATQSITVSLVTDGSELGNFTGTILGKQFTSATNGGSASFTIEATSDDPYENATFSITLTNASGNNITITNTHITDGSNNNTTRMLFLQAVKLQRSEPSVTMRFML